jgi:hypothetical protein
MIPARTLPSRSQQRKKGEQVMNRLQTFLATAVFVAATSLGAAAHAGHGGGGGMGAGAGVGQGYPSRAGFQVQQQTREQNRIRQHDGTLLQDTQVKSGSVQKKGKAYGPGDGTGNLGDRPLDGTGYGAPDNR